MSVPLNLSALTATVIPSLPYETSQDVNDGATTYTVWYSYTVTSADVAAGVLSVWGFGALGGYNPTTTILNGPATAPVSTGISATNIPVLVPLTTVGEVFYFRCAKNGNDSPAVLTLSVLRAPNQAVPIGAVGINDATTGFPLVYFDADTGEVLKFKSPFPGGESLWIQPTGELLVEDEVSGANAARLYDANLNLVASPSIPGTGNSIYINGTTEGDKFYCCRSAVAAQHAIVCTVSLTGVVGGTTWDLGTVPLHALAPSPDETILYYVTGGAIKRWDLVNDTGLSDIVPALGGYTPGDDIIVFPDGTFLVGYRAGSPHLVKHYSAAGATLHTYNMAVGEDLEAIYPTSVDGSSFGVWVQPDAQFSEFKTLRVSDGATIRTTGLTQKYNDGEYQGTETADPIRFGASFSCQPFMQRTALAPSTSLQPIPIPTSMAPQTPCVPDTEVSNGGKGNAGCNAGGSGFTSLVVEIGEVPEHPDPPEGEDLTRKEFNGIEPIVELVHRDEDDSITIYRRGMNDFDQGGHVEEGLLSVGEVEHALGNEQGGYEAATVDVQFSDAIDRLFRELLETEELEGDELRIRVISDLGRELSLDPRVLMRARVQNPRLSSGRLASLTAVDQLFSDFGPFGPDKQWPPAIPATLWPNAPPDTIGRAFPVCYGEKSDYGATDPITHAPASKGLVPLLYVGQQSFGDLGAESPEAPAITEDTSIDAPEIKSINRAANNIPDGWDGPVIAYVAAVREGVIGTISSGTVGGDAGVLAGAIVNIDRIDDDADSYIAWVSDDFSFHPVTNPTAGRVGTATHYGVGVNDYWLAARYAAGEPGVSNADYSIFVYPQGASAGPDVWDAYLVVLGASYRITQLYGSDLGGGDPTHTHDRTELVLAERNGSDILTPWDADGNIDDVWPFDDTFIDYTDSTTGITYRCTMVFARGPISDDHKNGVVNLTCNLLGREETGDGTGRLLFDAHDCEQHWIENELILGITSGTWCTNSDAPKWQDGVYQVRSSSFTARQAFTAESFGGRGLTVGWYVDEQKPVTDWIREWNFSTETRLGHNTQGQILVFGLDETTDTSEWPRIDHVSDVFGNITRASGEERENVVEGVCDWDPDFEKFRNAPLTQQSEAGITKYKGRRKQGDRLESTILNLDQQLEWVLTRRLARLQYGTTLVDIPIPISVVNLEPGDGFFLTSEEGTGSGWENRAFLVVRRRTNLSSWIVTYTCWDVGDLFIAERFEDGLSRLFELTDTDADAAVMTDDEDLAPILI